MMKPVKYDFCDRHLAFRAFAARFVIHRLGKAALLAGKPRDLEFGRRRSCNNQIRADYVGTQ